MNNNQCDPCDDKEKRALIIRGEDASLQFYVEDDHGNQFSLVGCTGVSGQFAQADCQTWLTVAGYVVSEDTGLAQVDIVNSSTQTLLLGTRQRVQLLLTFGSIIRKVQFNDALDVVDDLTSGHHHEHKNPWL